MFSIMSNMSMMPFTRFTEKESVRRWIIDFRFTFVHDLFIKKWIEHVNASLCEKSVDWTNSHLDVKIIRSLKNSLKANKQHFIKFLQKRYSGKSSVEITQVETKVNLEVLKQKITETLKEYYERTRDLLFELHTKNRIFEIDFIFIKEIMLSQTVVKFVNGIQNFKLRAEVRDRYLDVTNSANRSLKTTHDMIEQQTRIMTAKNLRMKLKKKSSTRQIWNHCENSQRSSVRKFE